MGRCPGNGPVVARAANTRMAADGKAKMVVEFLKQGHRPLRRLHRKTTAEPAAALAAPALTVYIRIFFPPVRYPRIPALSGRIRLQIFTDDLPESSLRNRAPESICHQSERQLEVVDGLFCGLTSDAVNRRASVFSSELIEAQSCQITLLHEDIHLPLPSGTQKCRRKKSQCPRQGDDIA